MAYYTLKQLLDMDIFTRADTVTNMTEDNKKDILESMPTLRINSKLKDAMARTPMLEEDNAAE